MEDDIEILLNLAQDLKAVAKDLKAKNIKNSIVFFGSARIPSEALAKEALAELKRKASVDPDALARAEKSLEMSHFYSAAEELAYRLALWAKEGPKRQDNFVICSGGGPSIMEAANKGAHRAQWHSLGISINISREQQPNTYTSPGLDFKIDTFLLRKFWLLHFMKAVIVFPGGFGTLDEAFEVLNLMSTRKMNPRMPFVFFGSQYWKTIINFDALVEHGTISADEAKLCSFADTIEEAFLKTTQGLEGIRCIEP